MNGFQDALKRAFKKHGGTITQDICPKHNCNKITVNGNEVCPQCKKEHDDMAITQKFYKDEAEYKKRIHNKIITEFLQTKSIMPKNLKNSLLDMSFDNYYPNTQEQVKNVHMAKNLIAEYNDGAEGNAFIQGKVGRGKTHLAMSMLKEFDGKGLFISLAEMFSLLNASVGASRDYPYTKEYFNNLLDQADLVVLDDLGAEAAIKDGRASGTTIQRLRPFYERSKRVITTSNLVPAEIESAYTSRVRSLVFSGTKNSENRILRFTDGNDYRLGGHAS
ncbi:ATP-binding protein [Apilactobacillus micheneri]|uniref:DnaA ATPase domain-containing protein n=1 Tax=Apilactobacillus micheneri TaxID=1899430 RepID=UPI00112C5C8F|nr:DnaA/Hda family protein [Apilactobacillus micheneri]TPR46996.1 ATP-binding protein [Apilactobacillus micheneri]